MKKKIDLSNPDWASDQIDAYQAVLAEYVTGLKSSERNLTLSPMSEHLVARSGSAPRGFRASRRPHRLQLYLRAHS